MRTCSRTELDLAIRCRRAGILAMVLSCCSVEIVHDCLKETESHAQTLNIFGGHCERALVFQDLRQRLLSARNMLLEEPEYVHLGSLITKRRNLPAPARLIIQHFLSTDACG